MRTSRRAAALPLLPLLTGLLFAGPLPACTGVVEEPTSERQRPEIPTGRPTTPETRRCDAPGPSSHLLRRLTPHQYRVVVGRLFPAVETDDIQLPYIVADKNAYTNNADRAAPVDEVVTLYHNAATEIAAAAVADTSWLSCELGSANCLTDALVHIAEEAFRRTLTADDRGAFIAFIEAESSREEIEILELAIQAILESPEFLYIAEAGDSALEAPADHIALTPDELATRLSLFLWDEPADASLRARAATLGHTDDSVATLVDEMIADERIDAGIARFASQWMPLREGDWGASYGRDDTVDNATREDLRASAMAFLRYAFLEASDLTALLTSREAFVNDRIAPLFGVDAPGSETLVRVTLPEGERAGILTHPAVLAMAPSDATFQSVYRGVMVMNQILCIPPGLPQFDMINVSEGSETGTTSRERLEREHLSPECNACHETIDGIGFAFENFDPSGRYRSDEHGQPIDASGNVLGLETRDVIDFVETVARREETRYCLTEHLYRYAIGISMLGNEDLCQVQHLADELGDSDGDLRGLARAVATSNSFRFIPTNNQETGDSE